MNIDNIQNFFNSLKGHISNGMKNVSEETQKTRYNICQSCDQYINFSRRCNMCGCFLDIKTSWAAEKCPIDKWGPEVTSDQNQEISSPQTQNSAEKSGGCGCNK